MLKSHSHLRLRDPETAYGIISAFPVHAAYPLGDRDALDKLFGEDHLAWEKMGQAAQSLVTRNQQASNTGGPPLFRINGCWEYKRKQIVDRGFILFGHSSNSLQDFMNSYDQPYILKTEAETETVSVFSDRGNNAGSVSIGDLQDPREILERIYSRLRAGTVFGNYTLSSFTESLPGSSLDVIFDFLRHIRQNGGTSPGCIDSVTLNDDRVRQELALLDRLRFKETVTTNRPTLPGLFKLLTYQPEPKPLIDASEARDHLREHVRVRGTVTEIETNRRGDFILRFGVPKEAFKVVIPASCALSKDHDWISGLKNRRMIAVGLISFYALESAMRVSEKEQVSLEG